MTIFGMKLADKSDSRLIVNPFRGQYVAEKFSNVNFLEIVNTDCRKEYYGHGNSGVKVLTQLQAERILQAWGQHEYSNN